MRVTPPDRQGLPPGRALVPFVATPQAGAAAAWPMLKAGILVASLGLAAGLGSVGHALWGTPSAPTASAAMVQKLQDQVARLQGGMEAVRTATDTARAEDQLRGVRRSVEALKQEIEQVRSGGATSTAQIAAKIDKADHDPSAKLADISARLDRMERDAGGKTGAEGQGAKLADLSGRIDRLEKQAAPPVTTGSIPAPRAAKAFIGPIKPAVAPTLPLNKAEVTTAPATVAASKPDRPATVTGWALRDVYDGMALVEARGGGLREVQPGEYLPGAGEVRSIERRGRAWVVTTSRGVIENATF